MPNLLQSGAAWLGQKLKVAAGRSVRVEQGTTVFELTASSSEHEYEMVESDGFVTKVMSHDWTFVASEIEALVPGFRFKNGATLTETLFGVECKYEALPIGKRPCVERLDSSGVLLTLHTKKVG